MNNTDNLMLTTENDSTNYHRFDGSSESMLANFTLAILLLAGISAVVIFVTKFLVPGI